MSSFSPPYRKPVGSNKPLCSCFESPIQSPHSVSCPDAGTSSIPVLLPAGQWLAPPDLLHRMQKRKLTACIISKRRIKEEKTVHKHPIKSIYFPITLKAQVWIVFYIPTWYLMSVSAGPGAGFVCLNQGQLSACSALFSWSVDLGYTFKTDPWQFWCELPVTDLLPIEEVKHSSATLSPSWRNVIFSSLACSL